MCVHKREASRKMSQAHDKINKERATERLKRQGGDGSNVVREALSLAGLVNRPPGRPSTSTTV